MSLVVQLPCLASGVITALHSAVMRQNFVSRCTTAASLWWADCHSQVLCVSGTLVLHSWAASTASCRPNLQNTLCAWHHWPRSWHCCGRMLKRCVTVKQNGKEVHLKGWWGNTAERIISSLTKTVWDVWMHAKGYKEPAVALNLAMECGWDWKQPKITNLVALLIISWIWGQNGKLWTKLSDSKSM